MYIHGRVITTAILITAIICLMAGIISAGDNISARFGKRLSALDDTSTVKVWVFFTDKNQSPDAFQKAAVSLSARASARRKNIPIDWYDLPVNSDYINAVEAISNSDVRTSRWLNAVSTRLTRTQIETLAAENFVKKIDPVAVGRRRTPEPPTIYEKPRVIDSSEYGNSFLQNHMLGIDSLHRLYVPTDPPTGDTVLLDGSGVLLAFFDTGFWTSHIAFNSMSIIDTYDFINDDPDVTDNLPIASQVNHGTSVLSVCGGYESGQLIGPAYGADYALYKTERSDSEIVIEEDFWVFASERADFIGADIISASLGYYDWYTYEDMNGDSAITTIAADIAASRGILVVTAAGNEGDDPWHYIIAPADGDSVMAIGAINASGIIADFSSFGPTYDGRIKPEVVAMGVGVRGARASGGYGPNWGTSVATPLIAGSAALLLQANPILRGNPMAIRERLMMAADQYLDPDFQYGYGQPDMVVAAGFGIKIHPDRVPNIHIYVDSLSDPVIAWAYSPLDEPISYTSLDFPDNITLSPLPNDSVEIVVRGDSTQIGEITYHLEAVAGVFADTLRFSVVTDSLDTPFEYGPNPFSDGITIEPPKPCTSQYLVEVFTLAGELIFYRTESNCADTYWDGTNQHHEKAASGVYIIRLSADGIDEKIKVLKL